LLVRAGRVGDRNTVKIKVYIDPYDGEAMAGGM
jgi:hypothetical protein